LPLLIWAYPTEYKDKNSAGQNDQNPNEFTFLIMDHSSIGLLKDMRWDDASFPIIGEEEPGAKWQFYHPVSR
jgi:hypothetical protein